MKKLLAFLLFTLSSSLFTLSFAQTGHWSRVNTPAPHANEGVCILMPDGTVLCHNIQGGSYGTGWDRLTPDIHGSYANGTWDTIASMNNDRLFFSSQVLPSGKLYVAGGEYGPGGVNGEVYDPATNTWTMCGPIPTNWSLYDANSEILYNGNVLEGPQIADTGTQNCLIWSPITNNYTVAATALYGHDEAQWIKLKDSTILYVGIITQSSNRYFPKNNTWVNDGAVPVNLWDGLEEAGPGLMLPNGNSILFGATPANTIYTPSGNSSPGTFSVADSFPTINATPMGQSDAPAAMMVNGKILCAIAPSTSGFAPPTYFVEYDYLTNTFTRNMDTIPFMNGGDSIPLASYQTQMVDMPDGSVLVSMSQSSSYSTSYIIYTPAGNPIPQGKPTIDNYTETSCGKFRVIGKLFNGISEGAAYGDDWQMETNFPLVRLTNGTNVYYARTSDWNRIGAVATDSLEDTAYFTLPSMPGGTYTMVVVANGFASNPVIFQTFGVAISSQTNINCTNPTGSATAFAADGATPYTYKWSPSGGTNPTATGLSVGTYTVTVTDNSGCAVSVTVTITQTSPLGVSTSVSAVTCNGGNNGSANAIVSGGTSPFTYAWSGGGGTNATATGLSMGTYTITVMDSCGFTATSAATITQPNVVSLSIDSINNLPCHGYSNGSASVFANPGTAPYMYNWSGGGGTNATATGLSAGTYTVTVTDSCGNTATTAVTLTEPSAIKVKTDSINATTLGCDGEAWVTASGGNPPYTYLWTAGGQTTDTIKGQCPGNYCCIVTDSNGCESPVCITILLGEGLNNIQNSANKILIYPNPNNGSFELGIRNYESGMKYQVEIYNVLGEKVYFNYQITKSSNHQIDLSSNPDGLYFYRVVKQDGSMLGEGKIVIEK